MNERGFKELYQETFDPFPKKKIFIVGGDYHQSVFLARANRLQRGMWRHVSSTQDLLGERSIQIVFYGTWYKRSDAGEIAAYVDILVREKIAEIVELNDHPQT